VVTRVAGKTPLGARPNRDSHNAARVQSSGRLLELSGDAKPRGMIVHDKTRLIGWLFELLYFAPFYLAKALQFQKGEFMHQSVLLNEAVAALNIKPNGVYVDGTFGRGGHSAAILEKLNDQGRLIVVDKDLAAISVAKEKYQHDQRVTIVHRGFGDLKAICDELQIKGQVDGILLDLGVSSPQLDEAERGFSFMKAGPLDMRMDQSQGMSIAEFLQTINETTLADILWRYGEEKFSRRIAKAIIAAGNETPITTTTELAAIIESAMPKTERHKHPATRSFQALRIYINKELEELEQALHASIDILKSAGRLAIITFHSLEDRMVKHFMQSQVKGPEIPRGLPLRDSEIPNSAKFHWCVKMQVATELEIQANIRSRSAILRVVERR